MEETTVQESITRWIDGVRSGDQEAARLIWATFFDRLLSVARQRLQKSNRKMSDEEDIVISAFKSFCAGVQQGKFPDLRGREDLWRLLFVITARKIADQFAYQRRDKRDVQREATPKELQSTNQSFSELFLSREPSPEFAVECAEQLECLLDQLQLDDLKRIAILKLEGHTNQEIAHIMERGLTTIERKLRTIREIWSHTQT